jgi:hypothetical protein
VLQRLSLTGLVGRSRLEQEGLSLQPPRPAAGLLACFQSVCTEWTQNNGFVSASPQFRMPANEDDSSKVIRLGKCSTSQDLRLKLIF